MLKLILCCLCYAAVLAQSGCTANNYHRQTDELAALTIAEMQKQALGREEPFSIERPADILRYRLLRDQDLPIAGPASLGSGELPPPANWPGPPLKPTSSVETGSPEFSKEISLSLAEAIQIAAQNSREYQNRKEDLFRSALALDFERNNFRSTFAGSIDGEYTQDRSGSGNVVEGSSASLLTSASKLLTSGVSLTTRIGWDLVRMLQPGRSFSSGLFGDASITIPLLRGAGQQIAAEPLTQAERDTLYAVWEFKRFKREFVVNLINRYLAVLQADDRLRNQAENYRGLIASSRRASRLAEAGKLPQLQVDQSLQNELRARDRWVAARQFQAQALDEFKILLGLPTDAAVMLDRAEFIHLEAEIGQRLNQLFNAPASTTTPAADTPINLLPPDPQLAGPLELGDSITIELALNNRLDLRMAQARVNDSQRKVVVAADALRPELTLFGSVNTGTGRSIAALQPDDNNRLDLDEGIYQGLLTLDLGLERTAEAIAYRESLIRLEEAVRSVQQLEDQIKLEVRNARRQLEQARASLKTQDQAVALAERRVRGAELQLQAGRAEIRDLLEARESLLSAQNALTTAMVDYRIAELELQRDLGLLQVDAEGRWQEYIPGDTTDE